MQPSTLLALVVRISIALATRTFFQPDEYFQSLEVAHHLVFGYGHLTWEWLSPNPIRSIFYPALNVPVYWLLKVLNLDSTKLLIWAPKVLHGAFAAVTDIWLCELTRKVLGERYVSAALFLSLTSFFHGLSLSRSISNSLETSLTVVALSYFPWDAAASFRRRDVRKVFMFAALACAVRPTSAVIWAYMFATLILRVRLQPRYVYSLLVDVLAIGGIALSVLFILDSAYYGTPTFTPLNFLRTNLSSVSLFYGSSPWHYYFTQAIPILCTTALPFVAHGAWLISGFSGSASQTLLGLLAWTIGVYSLAGHKEWRFIHPLLPVMHIMASKSLVDSFDAAKPRSGADNAHSVTLPIRGRHLSLLLLALPAIAYVSLFHSRAQIGVMDHLRSLPTQDVLSVGFLMPCHSTPWQAYLHRPELAIPGMLWALGCEPPLLGEDVSVYKDQTDIFYDSPATYFRTYFPSAVDPTFPPSSFPCTTPASDISESERWSHEWPQHVVIFGALLDMPEVRGLLEGFGYAESWRMGGWEADVRRRGGVRIWRYSYHDASDGVVSADRL
ncbi:glycosyltransferase family 22 protein [Sparassis latifolia]